MKGFNKDLLETLEDRRTLQDPYDELTNQVNAVF